MDFEETQQDGQRPRALLGIALVVVLLVAAGALFFVWRPEAYQGAVAALTSNPQDASEPMVSAGATPLATGQTPAATPAVAAAATPGTRTPRSAASESASVEQVVQQQGGLEQRLAATERRLARLDLQAQAAAGNAARAEGLLISFATRRSIERGAELGYLADQLRLRFGDALPNAVRTLTEMSRKLSNLFVIRRQTAPSPQPRRRLERAKMFLQTGRYEAAIEEVQNMPGASAADQWVADVRRYAAAQRALDLIETAAVVEPNRLRDGSGERVEQPSPAVSPGPTRSAD